MKAGMVWGRNSPRTSHNGDTTWDNFDDEIDEAMNNINAKEASLTQLLVNTTRTNNTRAWVAMKPIAAHVPPYTTPLRSSIGKIELLFQLAIILMDDAELIEYELEPQSRRRHEVISNISDHNID